MLFISTDNFLLEISFPVQKSMIVVFVTDLSLQVAVGSIFKREGVSQGGRWFYVKNCGKRLCAVLRPVTG